MDDLFKGLGTEMVGLSPMDRAQAVWNLRQKMYAKAGVISSPSYLRMERTLDSQVSVIEFDLTDGNGGTTRRVTEKRLKVGDTFTAMGGLMLLSTSEITAPATESDNQELQTQRLYTYPNPTAFGVSAPNLMGLYNASHQLTIDSTVFIEGMSTRDFYRVGTAQEGYGVGGAGNVAYQNDSWNYQNWGQAEFTPTLEISGQADVKPVIRCGTSIDFSSQDSAVQNNIVLYYYGYLNTGASSVFNDWLKALKDHIAPEDIPALPVFKSIR